MIPFINRKELIEKHEIVVRKDNEVRKMKELIDVKRKDKTATSRNLDIARPESVVAGQEWDVDEMKNKVELAKSKLKREQNQIDKQSIHQEDKIKEQEHHNRLLALKVKEKDKELSLLHLKTKELKRNIRFNTLKPIQNTPGNRTTRRKAKAIVHK